MDTRIDVARAARRRGHAQEEEARDAHAQQDGEEELGPTGRVHPSVRRAGLWKPFVGGGLCGGSPEAAVYEMDAEASQGFRALLETRRSSPMYAIAAFGASALALLLA